MKLEEQAKCTVALNLTSGLFKPQIYTCLYILWPCYSGLIPISTWLFRSVCMWPTTLIWLYCMPMASLSQSNIKLLLNITHIIIILMNINVKKWHIFCFSSALRFHFVLVHIYALHNTYLFVFVINYKCLCHGLYRMYNGCLKCLSLVSS